uniref:Uncharacterized protein n=1 Tax=Anguilla anguilla TaxID=7936 RepID=A0A0E9X5V7_ANGAN
MGCGEQGYDQELQEEKSHAVRPGCYGRKLLPHALFGGVMVFIFGITFPLLLVCAHASTRLRNLKNKLENKIEGVGLKKTPMGIIMEALGQQEENFNKIQDFLESKIKE